MPGSTSFPSPADGLAIAVHTWRPEHEPVGVLQLEHGVAEHATRYDRLARALTGAGWTVVANDHRGHGASTGPDVPRGSFGAAGWAGLVADVVELTRRLREAEPGLPLVLLGHSMGSFAVQQVLLDHSAEVAAAVLSGTTAVDVFGAALAESGGGDLTALNEGFEPRTGFEWLSRDEAEVDAYVADPESGFDLDPDVLPAMLGTGDRLADPSGVRADLPVLLLSGTDDPLAGGGDLVRLVARRYRDAGVLDVDVDLYRGARHEVFNEVDRDEVTADLLGWLDGKVVHAARQEEDR